MNNFNELSLEDKLAIETHPILKENKVNFPFVLRNYGKCHSFLNEIIQTEGITVYEHNMLREISRVF